MKNQPPRLALEGRFLEASATELYALVRIVTEAVMKRFPQAADIEAMYPDRVVYRDGPRYFAVPYTVGADNTVTLSDPQEVVEQHVPVREAQVPQLAPGVFCEAVGDPSAGRWLIRVIRAGLSGNANFYPDAVLREAVGLFEGARVFVKSDLEHTQGQGKDVRNLIGGLSSPRFVEGAAPDTGEILAVLTLIEPEGDTAVKLREAKARGLANLFGFSIDANGTAKTQLREGRKVRVATRITQVKSVDLIVEPGAGGELIRLIEAVDPHQEQTEMKDKLLKLLAAKAPAQYAKIDPATVTEDELVTMTEALMTAPAPQTQSAANDDVTALRESLAALQLTQAKSDATAMIAASGLPEKTRTVIAARFAEAKEVFTADTVKAAIDDAKAIAASFTESGRVSLPFGAIELGDRKATLDEMFDAFFDPAHKDHRNVRSFKECYIQATGDRYVTGLVRDMDMTRLREAAGADFRESVSSATFANVLGNSLTRRLQAAFAGMTDLQLWRRVASVVPVNDFRTQERVRIGGYGNLPIVAEAAGYNALTTPSDAKATYTLAKRGGTEDVTLESIRNDDVGALRRIPQELALSAANTLFEFVFDFFRTNPTIWDATALYTAGHNNLFVAALSAAEFSAHRLAMMKQTRSGSGKRMAVGPGLVLVPPDLEETGYNLFVRNQNLDKNFVQTVNPTVLPIAYWTDANDWVTLADPAKFPVLEIGFLDGREEPDLFVQDMPNVGSMFSNDKLTYKIRHIYSGNILVDGEKGTTKAVVP